MSKEVIQKLIKIAENQQKIINKLAQAIEGGSGQELAAGSSSGTGSATAVEGGDPNKKAEGVCRANLAKLPGFKLESVTVTGMEGNRPQVAIKGTGGTEASIKGMCVEYFLNNLKIPTFVINA